MWRGRPAELRAALDAALADPTIGPPAEDPPGFDRAAFHARLNAEISAFFDRTLKK